MTKYDKMVTGIIKTLPSAPNLPPLNHSGPTGDCEIEEDDNEISLDTDWRMNKVVVVARVPRNASVELQTVNDGEIIVSNLTGNHELYNTNGPITATNISGSVIAESVNDTIDIGFTRIDPDNASSMESLNGDLILGLPAGIGVTTHLDTSRGEIYSDFEVEVRETESVIVADINGGGPTVRMKSLHGDINIRKD
jgi:hypothetical protein